MPTMKRTKNSTDDGKPVNLARHAAECKICAHANRLEIEREFVGWVDWTRMVEWVQAAESEIHKGGWSFLKPTMEPRKEREAVVNALNGLRVLRMDAAA
jgi:hypothetical protein